MFYQFKSRLLIQKPNGNKYYYHVVSATTDHSYPFSIPVASIEVIANSGTYDYISTLSFDDIARLQVSIQYSPAEKIVWSDLFSGRVLSSKAQYGTGTTATITCSGHIAETGYAIIDEAKVYASATPGAEIISYFADKYLSRTSITYPDGNPSISVAYTTKQAQKYMKDLLTEMEELTSNTWYFIAEPIYDSSNNLSSVPITFRPFSTVATKKYKAIQGTPRFLSGNFSSDGSTVYTSAIQFGKTLAAVEPATTGVQYKGSYTNTAKVTAYGLRTKVNTDTGLESNAICASFAQYYLPNIVDPRVIGTVTLEGTIKAQIGDLITVKIPSIDLNGSPISGDYTVLKVHHSISYNEFQTTLSVGDGIELDTEDYLSIFARENRLNLQNFVS